MANKVEDIYNGLGQVTGEYQAHSGAVDTSSTPEVQYGYSTLSNGSRQSDIIYPNGREIVYNYSSGVNADISRISSLSDSSGTLQSYQYQGTDTPMVTTDGNGVELDVTLDDFARTSDQNWTVGGSSILSMHTGHDQDGNIIFTAGTLPNQYYSYDGLNRIVSYSPGGYSPTETLTPDALGNVTSAFNYSSGGKDNSSNAQNESNLNQYDANGNTTNDTGYLSTDSAGNTYATYDAWNRMVYASGPNGDAAYTYDALGRRITENENDTTTDVYFSNRGQAIEERQSGATTTQYVWSPFYVNQLVERDDQPNGSGVLTERLYAQQDTNYNTIALTDSSGNIVQLYQYDAYGVPSYLGPSTSLGDYFGMQYLFQGGRYDAVTGFYHFGARNYDPVNQVWLQQDPAGYPDGANRYEMEGDDPTTMLDPTGLDAGWASRPSPWDPYGTGNPLSPLWWDGEWPDPGTLTAVIDTDDSRLADRIHELFAPTASSLCQLQSVLNALTANQPLTTLTIWGHGSPGKIVFGTENAVNGQYVFRDYADINPSTLSDPNSAASQALNAIAGALQPNNSTLCLAGCDDGKGDRGAQLKAAILAALSARGVNANVVLYQGYVHPGVGGTVDEDIEEDGE